MPRLQRVLLIFTFLLVTVMLGLLIYAVFFGPRIAELGNGAPGPAGTFGGPTGVAGPGGGDNTRLPGEPPSSPAPIGGAAPRPSPVSPVASGGLTRVQPVAGAAQSPTLDRDGVSLLYYDAGDGRFYRVNPDGAADALSDRVFHAVQNITWSNDRRRAVLEYPDGANVIYDFANGRQVTLPSHWEQFSFAPDGGQIVAKSIGVDPDNRWLVVSDSSGSGMRPVAPLGVNANRVIPSWSPNGQMVALEVEPSGAGRQEVFFIGLNDERFTSTVVPGLGFQGQWTPDGRQLLYSVHRAENGGRPELWLVDASPTTVGANRLNVRLQTWASKCAFAGPTLAYCAVPRALPEGAGLFPDELDNGEDSLYRVDLLSGAAAFVAAPDTPQTMRSLQVSGDGRYVYFTNQRDGKVYRIQLK